MWQDSPCGGYHFWLIPLNGGGGGNLKLLHARSCVQINEYTLIFWKRLGLSAKLEKNFLFHQNLSYSRYIKYFMTLFGTSPH